MAAPEKVTVDKTYFDALLRRADFHTSPQLLGRYEPTNVTIAKVEYDSLLRASREYELLKTALFQGGIRSETLDLLIAGTSNNDARKDSGASVNAWTDDFKDQTSTHGHQNASVQANASTPYPEPPLRLNNRAPTFNFAPGSGPYRSNSQAPALKPRLPDFHRQPSFCGAPFSVLDDAAYDDQGDGADGGLNGDGGVPHHFSTEKHTLYLSGFSESTTYREVLSVIKGGKILSITLRSDRSALLTMLEGAADFVAWAKRNDIYLNAKRIEVQWAERQYQIKGHIRNKIAIGATRNILIHNAFRNGLTEPQIREDMDHIHNLVIVDVTFRNGDALISTNSIHNALFARTCMLSRTSYKGCKIEFTHDECDVPVPARTFTPKVPASEPHRKKTPLSNRFGCLDIDGGEDSSNEENRTPLGYDTEDDEGFDMTSNVGVSLNFLDSEST